MVSPDAGAGFMPGRRKQNHRQAEQAAVPAGRSRPVAEAEKEAGGQDGDTGIPRQKRGVVQTPERRRVLRRNQ